MADAKKNPLGPTGALVARRVKQLRGARGWTYQRLSDLLAERGRPIPPLGLRRIEAEDRRIDVDDLIALAAAFDVAPNGLLFPVDARGVVEVTGIGPIAVEELWEWVEGRTPLSDEPDPDGSHADEFIQRSRPSYLAQPDMNTKAGRRRFGKSVDGQDGWQVTWSPEGEVETITVKVYGKWRPYWPDDDDDESEEREGSG